jgi:predicted AlkP superfamily phosphohydrolase/phosphomutase
VIVIGVDGMDPNFVEAHWVDLPNLSQLAFKRLATTTPPESPVAWSTFSTGLDPGEHGIFDFVDRDPVTLAPFLSTDKTEGPRFRFTLGPYEIPLTRSHVVSLRRGKLFWQTLCEKGVPVTVIRMPTNYPAAPFGRAISGMGTPDLRGTSSTFTFYTDDPDEISRAVSGGLIRKVSMAGSHCDLQLEGPPDTLRRDRQYASIKISVDLDPKQLFARMHIGNSDAILQEGEWSDWLSADFTLMPHVASARGMFRAYAKQLRPRFEMYISPVNVDPSSPSLPISAPAGFSRMLADEIGPYYTLGIPEDTAALRQGIFDLNEFLAQSRLVLSDERRLFENSLDRFEDGFLFFYFSSVDQNSHMLWGKHDEELLKVYRAIDECVGEARKRSPTADLMVMSDHGFTTFDRAVNLNSWLRDQGFGEKAYAVGLNALYLKDRNAGDSIRTQLLAWRDPQNGRAVVEVVAPVHASAANRKIAPDFIVGYARGYRASWQTGLGETTETELDDNNDAWIADHCINAADVPGVLFTSWKFGIDRPSLKDLGGTIVRLFEAHTGN